MGFEERIATLERQNKLVLKAFELMLNFDKERQSKGMTGYCDYLGMAQLHLPLSERIAEDVEFPYTGLETEPNWDRYTPAFGVFMQERARYMQWGQRPTHAEMTSATWSELTACPEAMNYIDILDDIANRDCGPIIGSICGVKAVINDVDEMRQYNGFVFSGKEPGKVTKAISLQDLHDAWNYGKQSSENYIGKDAKDSAMVARMAEKLGLS